MKGFITGGTILKTAGRALAALILFSPPAFAQPKEILLGALLPLTGPAASIGIEEQQGGRSASASTTARASPTRRCWPSTA